MLAHTTCPAQEAAGPASLQYSTLSCMQPSQHHGSRVGQGKRRECTENGVSSLKCYHSEVTPMKSTPISLAKVSHTIVPNFKVMGNCNVFPEGEELSTLYLPHRYQQADTIMCPFLGQLGWITHTDSAPKILHPRKIRSPRHTGIVGHPMGKV